MQNILFLFRILCLPDQIIYKRVAWYIHGECMNTIDVSKIPTSRPIADMYKMVCNYGLQGRLRTCVINNEFGYFNAHKSIIKSIVWGSEIMRWRATCYLYHELSMYVNFIRSMIIVMWCKLSSQDPHTTEKVCSLMAVIMGTQPTKMFRNMGNAKQMCGLYNTRIRENPKQVLFQYPGLEPFRANGWRQVVSSMPPTMTRELERMDHDRKLGLIASGLMVASWENAMGFTSNPIFGRY